jgi:hypothetical protein
MFNHLMKFSVSEERMVQQFDLFPDWKWMKENVRVILRHFYTICLRFFELSRARYASKFLFK